MNIKAIITKLFKNNDSPNAIINLDDVIKFPNRKDINNDILLFQIDQFKEEYLNLLKQNGYILPNLLSSNELRDEMSMNIDLIVKQYLSDEEIPNDKVTFVTKYLKLKLYLEKLEELGNIVLTRLIALKEIKDERIIISKHKRHRITYEINSLLSIMIMFNSQRNALEKESNIYHDKILTFDNGLNLNKDEINIINKKLKDVIKLVNFIYPKIKTDEYSSLIDLVALEQELEIYVYKHKDELEKIKADFNGFKTDDLPYIDVNIFKRRIKKLKECEMQYRIFNEYGRNLITDEEMLDIYRTKFKVLTNRFYDYKKDIKLVTDNTTDRELESYKTIVSEMIEDIVKGNTFNIEAYDESDIFTKRKAINYMIKLLKNGEETFDAEEILYSNFLLNLLLAFTNQKYLPSFFSKYKIYYPILNDYITWDKYLPLDTIFIINDIYKKSASSTDSSYELSDEMMVLKGLYSMVKHNIKYDLLTAKNKHEANIYLGFGRDFYLPEGIKSIKMVLFKHLDDMNFYEALMENATDSTVVFPNSLESVEGNIFTMYNWQKRINEIKLNDGLRELDLKLLVNQKGKTIIIPSSVSKINYNMLSPGLEALHRVFKIDYKTLCDKEVTIYFYDFRESKILNSDDELKNLFKAFMLIPHQRVIDLWQDDLVFRDSVTGKTHIIDLTSIKDEVIKKWETMEYWAPLLVIDYAVEIFKEDVYLKTGYMLGGYNNQSLDNVARKLLPKELKVNK